MDDKDKKIEPKKIPSSHVRFTEDEYEKLLKAQAETGLSIPDLLKKAFFKHRTLLQPLLSKEHVEQIMVELRRHGNNLNQIAKQINSGLRQGWNPSFNAMTKGYVDIRHLISVNRANS
jgi:hypothetical protein